MIRILTRDSQFYRKKRLNDEEKRPFPETYYTFITHIHDFCRENSHLFPCNCSGRYPHLTGSNSIWFSAHILWDGNYMTGNAE